MCGNMMSPCVENYRSYVNDFTCMQASAYKIHTYTHVHVHVHISTYVYTCACVHACTICMYVRAYMYIHFLSHLHTRHLCGCVQVIESLRPFIPSVLGIRTPANADALSSHALVADSIAHYFERARAAWTDLENLYGDYETVGMRLLKETRVLERSVAWVAVYMEYARARAHTHQQTNTLAYPKRLFGYKCSGVQMFWCTISSGDAAVCVHWAGTLLRWLIALSDCYV